MGGLRALFAALVTVMIALGGGMTVAQEAEGTAAQSALRSPVLLIDPERLFQESRYGQRILDELRADSEALAAENRRIEADLTEEERALTEQRPSMSAADFRAAADAFDEKVQGIRRAQDAKETALQNTVTEGREAFFGAAQNIIGRLMVDAGSVVVLDRRSVFLSIGAIDITESALEAVNAELGDGTRTNAE
ncbi:MAG: OmpH family outer membrane protein [Marivivens sp.]|nr:OmpH family outer membrane protein [Marivivens sp.]